MSADHPPRPERPTPAADLEDSTSRHRKPERLPWAFMKHLGCIAWCGKESFWVAFAHGMFKIRSLPDLDREKPPTLKVGLPSLPSSKMQSSWMFLHCQQDHSHASYCPLGDLALLSHVKSIVRVCAAFSGRSTNVKGDQLPVEDSTGVAMLQTQSQLREEAAGFGFRQRAPVAQQAREGAARRVVHHDDDVLVRQEHVPEPDHVPVAVHGAVVDQLPLVPLVQNAALHHGDAKLENRKLTRCPGQSCNA